MLKGGGALNPDGLALDLAFALDKTLTSRKGPTPTFTRSSTGTFVGSNGLIQSAAINGPRFDHDPATGASKGLLIEETRTNLLLGSESFEATSWIKGGPQPAVITADNIISPSGTLTADTLAMPAIALNQYSLAAQQFSGTAVPYTLTFYVKSATGGQTIWASLTPDGVNYFRQSIILTTQWQRVSLTATLTATQWFAQIGIDRRDLSQTGTGGFEFHAWGAQVEAGAFPLSYIPTTSGTAARSADVCSIIGTDFTSIWNGVDATILFIGSRIANQISQTNWELSSGTTATRIASDRGATTERIVADAAGIMNTAAFTTLSEYKIATALRTGDYAVSFNGASALTSSSAFVLTLNRLTIGVTRIGSGQINGWIQSIKFYKKRLSNAKLQDLTAP